MSDLRLITILLPQPIQGIQQSQVTNNKSQQQTGLSNIQAGSILSGFIINRDVNGNPILRTNNGDITFASNFFLKIGSEITIRIEHIANSNSAHILSVNGQAPEIATSQPDFLQKPEVIVSENLLSTTQPPTNRQSINVSANSAITTSAISSSPPSPNVTLNGTIISQTNAPPSSLPNTLPKQTNDPTSLQKSTLPNGSQLSLKIISLSTPQNISQPTITRPAIPIENITLNTTIANSSIQNSIPNSPISNISAPNLSESGNSNLKPIAQPSSPYAAYVRATTTNIPIIAPFTVDSLPENLPQAIKLQNITTIEQQVNTQITASVISNTQNEEAIIQTPIGMIQLQKSGKLPIGSHLIFEINQIKTPESIEISANNVALTTPLTQLARNSGALSNIFSLLTNSNSSDALNFINKNIPTINLPTTATNNQTSQPAHNLLESMIIFTSALRNGDFRTWLGRSNSKWLKDNGHENLLIKAESEFLSLSRQLINTPEKQWQSLFFPIAIEGDLHQARLFIKREHNQKQKNGKKSNEEDTRFILEMDLSQLGEMQMDGFIRRNNENIQFDLIIRSHTPLTQEIQNNIIEIYNNTGELTGYKGNASFQTTKDFPVNPMEDIISNKDEGIIA